MVSSRITRKLISSVYWLISIFTGILRYMSAATELTNQIINYVYCQGGYSWRASSTGIYDQRLGTYRTAAKKGVSDVLCCWKGRLIAVEVKIGKDRLSPEQDGFMRNIIHAGGIAFTASDFNQFKREWALSVS